jgi:2-amino-4-hydroxy-6-hydroxymethyldihydropteridine diphosphokinase
MALVRRVVPLMLAQGNLQWDDVYPNPQVFAEDIAAAQLWVAEQDGAIAGVAAITTDQSPEYADVGWDLNEPATVVHRLAVDPAFRGAGVAGALMQQAEVVARERGINVMRVDTNNQNPATQRLFPKLGYTLAGEIGLAFRPGLRFLCYEKRLRPERHTAAIALGSNLPSEFGDPAANLCEAIRRLGELGQVRAVSTFYTTAPVGYTDQPNFTNAAALLGTSLEPLELMRALLNIEHAMGRDRSAAVPPKGPRIIDLDLLLVDDIVLNTPELTLPHPALAERRFVLEPLAEIAQEMLNPITRRTVREMLHGLADVSPERATGEFRNSI